MKQRLKPLYDQLQGYLSQTPLPSHPDTPIMEPGIWERYNSAVKEIAGIAGDTYAQFRLQPKPWGGDGSLCINLFGYRQQLGGLIMRLHGEFFADEAAPFSGSQGTVNIQTTQVNQSLVFQMVLEFQSKIDEKVRSCPEDSKERTFWQEFKKILGSVSDTTDLFTKFLTRAGQFGLTLQDLLKFFS